jgi:PIN domain nuclease of toxin-antitoxin system
MKILIDTHIFLWMFLTPSRISPNVEKLLKDSANEIFFSSASSWEISIKHSIGKLKLPDAPEADIPDRIERANLKRLKNTRAHIRNIVFAPNSQRPM